jgi:hypothetical protein
MTSDFDAATFPGIRSLSSRRVNQGASHEDRS